MRTKLTTYFALLLTAFLSTSLRAADDAKEAENLAILRSDKDGGEKALACKQLAIYGSAAAVPELAKLLPDPKLHSWARIALEAIPGPEADQALREAANALDGRLLIGCINSLGVRRDAKAVESLIKRLEDKDPYVAIASAISLGKIGGPEATKSLRGALAGTPGPVRSAVAEGCILCAEQLLAADKAKEATGLYDEVRKADLPKQRIVEATRGAILARKEDGLPLLVEQLKSEDVKFLRLGLQVAREFPGKEIDKSLAAELAKAEPEKAALLIQAMADRGPTVVLPAILKAAAAGPKEVRLSAIGALARVGDATCLNTLLDAALDADVELSAAAKKTVADLPGDKKVDAEVVALLPKSEGKKFAMLIDIVGKRRIEATAALQKALDSSDKVVRAAALQALGETVDAKGLPMLINLALSPKKPEDADTAQEALKAASIRMPDREACAADLVAALNKQNNTANKVVLLEILGAVGGTKALAAVGAAGKTKDADLQDASTKALGEWTTPDAAPVCLDLAKNAPGEKYQVRAMKGYIRIARQMALPEAEKIDMCKKAMDAARPAEQKLVLEVLKRNPTEETFAMAIKAMKSPELKDEAGGVTLAIAQALSDKGVDVKDQLAKAGFEKVKVEVVKAEYGAESTQKDVTAILQKQISDLPILTLPDKTYNKSFGGDPAPGMVKKLKIQYKINGKAGEATFAEGALIVLPMPK
jgi:HEAT repeat protein